MKPAPLLIGLLLCLLAGCAAPKAGKSKTGARAPGQHMVVRTTAYTHTEAGGHKNGIGGRLKYGGDNYSAAADWSWLPLGTRFRMPCTGRTYVIEDYGSALVGRQTIDLYLPSRQAVRNWGVRNVEIEILEWGSTIMSLKLLEGRQRSAHVRRMVTALRSQPHRPPG